MRVADASTFMEELKRNGEVCLPIGLAYALVQGGEFNGTRILGAECFAVNQRGWMPMMEHILDLTRLSSPHYTPGESVKALFDFLEGAGACEAGNGDIIVCIDAKV